MPNNKDTKATRIVYHLVHRNADGQWHLTIEGDEPRAMRIPPRKPGAKPASG